MVPEHYVWHRLHVLAIASPVIVFLALAWFRWNRIYSAIIAMFVGSVDFAASFGAFWSGVYEHMTWRGEQCATNIGMTENLQSPNLTTLERSERLS